MTRVSIFGTTRPDIGAIVHFNTSGENETALDEDIFEKKVIEHFEKNSCLSYKRMSYFAATIMRNGEISDLFHGIGRAESLMNALTLNHPNQYIIVSRGYITIN